MSTWKISGQYMETCNCTLLCPCITSNLAARPTEGDCKAAVALRIDKGEKDGVKLDGLSFVLMMHSPGAMGEGNITVGLIVDDAASEQQVEAISAIATGAAGGPMAALAPLVGRIAGVERRPIHFEADGLNCSLRAGDLVDQACEGLPSVVDPQAGDRRGQHRASGQQPAVHSQGHAQQLQRLRHRLGRQQRHAQRALCAVRLGGVIRSRP